MKLFLILALSGILSCQVHAQTVSNGNFNNGTTSWGCNPETNTESVYGGTSTTNQVAEVDAVAGLCQTINGFAVGAYYRLSFRCSRRTSCGPTVQSMNVTMSGGVINRSVSRNGTAFSLTNESIDFVATSASHVLTFTGTTAETCNLLVDNIQITLVSGLPVELSFFGKTCSDNQVLLNWTTESEARTDYFTLESSADGSSWEEVAQVDAQFNSQSKTDYFYSIEHPVSGTKYYRLRLTDMDGTDKILSSVSSNCENEQVLISPNPTNGICRVNASVGKFAGIFDSSGRKVSEMVTTLDKNCFEADLSSFVAGMYFLQVGDTRYKIIKE